MPSKNALIDPCVGAKGWIQAWIRAAYCLAVQAIHSRGTGTSKHCFQSCFKPQPATVSAVYAGYC